MVTIKICGVRDARGAEAVGQSGADYAGFIFVEGRRRAVDPQVARDLRHRLGTVQPVGVFLDAAADHIRHVAEHVGLAHIQLHGSESPELGFRLREAGYSIIRAVSLRRPDSLRSLQDWADVAEIFLVDGPRPGSGEPINSAHLPAEGLARPTWLAGGLAPDNVQERLTQASFEGVDVSSGVELEGRQDPDRIQAFVAAARP